MTSTFHHRDARLAAIGAAVAAAADGSAEKVALLAEQDELSPDRFAVSDRNAVAIGTNTLWRLTSGIKAWLAGDPLAVVTGSAAPLADALIAAVETLPRSAEDPRPGFLDECVAQGLTSSQRDLLIETALGEWLRIPEMSRPLVFREVGVALPLRLETVFKQESGNWKLALRIIPDDLSVIEHEPLLTLAERHQVERFWARSTIVEPGAGVQPNSWLASPEGARAFSALAAHVGGPRAAWLISAFPVARSGSTFQPAILNDAIGKHGGAGYRGIPPLLGVYIEQTDGQLIRIGELKPKPSQESLRLETFKKGQTEGDGREHPVMPDHWLVSWAAAVEQGMGVERPLPAGVTPDSISALFVVGLGDEEAASHFSALDSAGDLALMQPGEPTNTLNGTPAAELLASDTDWLALARARLGDSATLPGQGAAAKVSEALCGCPDLLRSLPGRNDSLGDSELLVRALFPVLWGHWYRDVWERTDDFPAFWAWCDAWLRPEGPFLPIRVGKQPYGLLPMVDLKALTAPSASASDDDRVEYWLCSMLEKLLEQWTKAAAARGTVVGGSAETILDLLARPGVSERYAARTFLDAGASAAPFSPFLQGQIVMRARGMWRPAKQVMNGKETRPLLTNGGIQPLELPLIGADRLLPTQRDGSAMRTAAAISFLFESPSESTAFWGRIMNGVVPDSLLLRLMIHATFLARAWYAQPVPAPLRNPARWLKDGDIPIVKLQGDFHSRFVGGVGDPLLHRRLRAMWSHMRSLCAELDPWLEVARDPLPHHEEQKVTRLAMPDPRRKKLERALRATLDCAAHRIDPFVTGIATRRLRQQIDSGRSRHRLGCYGWVDGPFLGKPGPTPAGVLRAPSPDQVLTATVLRDRQLASGDPSSAQPRFDLWSRQVREAMAIFDDLKRGMHLFEAVGRRVEGILGRRQPIERVRELAPMRHSAPDARETCNGIQALAKFTPRDATGDFAVPDTKFRLLLDADMKDQLEKLRNLTVAVETMGELLLVEGVHQTVAGHGGLAHTAMHAAGGLAPHPEFSFIRSNPSAYRLETAVLGVFPAAPGLAPLDGPAIALADPALAAFLAATAAAEAPQWQWVVRFNDEGGNPASSTVGLSQLDLLPLDLVFLADDVMASLVLALAGAPMGEVEHAAGWLRFRRLATGLGSAPPDAGAICMVPNQEETAAPDDGGPPTDAMSLLINKIRGSVANDLAARITHALEGLDRVMLDAPPLGSAADIVLPWLRRCLSWGVAPAVANRSPSLLFRHLAGTESGSDTQMERNDLVSAALNALAGRRANHEQWLSPADDNGSASADARLAPNEAAARQLGKLVSGNERLAITAQIAKADVLELTSLDPDQPEDGALEDWLSTLASVNQALAAVDALQLDSEVSDASAPLTGWCNFPKDPWRRALIKKNADPERYKTQADFLLEFHRLIVAFGPSDAWSGDEVAVTLLTSFGESIPLARRGTTAAFGFNAPSSRPPQAILLAVPADREKPLSEASLVETVRQARTLVRARAVDPGDVAGNAAFPSLWFDDASSLRMRLDEGMTYAP